jgi:hypothetical protein
MKNTTTSATSGTPAKSPHARRGVAAVVDADELEQAGHDPRVREFARRARSRLDALRRLGRVRY